jgi:excisionase family DNA binding protein
MPADLARYAQQAQAQAAVAQAVRQGFLAPVGTQACRRCGAVAARIQAHPVTVRRWLESGRLKGYRPGGTKLGWRVPESEVERFLRGEPQPQEQP